MTELHPKKSLSEKEKLELNTLAANFLFPHINGGFLSISIVPNVEIGMNINYINDSTFHLNIYDTYINFIYDGLYLFLSDKSIFQNIGVSSHLMKIPSFDYNLPKKCYNDFKLDLDDFGRAKFDEERKELHYFLFKTSIALLVLHECQHILNGHCGFYKYNKIKNGKDAIEKGKLTPLDIQTLEMDADAIAIQELYKILTSNLQNNEIPEKLKCEKVIIESLTFLTFFIFNILPRGKKYNSVSEIKNLTHPSNPIRFHLMISTLESFFNSTKNTKQLDVLEESVKSNINFFVTSVKNISGEKLDLNELLLSYKKENLEFINQIVENWNYLRHKIAPFSYKKLVHYTPKFLNQEVKYNYSQLIINLKEILFNYDSMLFANNIFINKLRPLQKQQK